MNHKLVPPSETVVVVLTPAGRGAVASVLVEGDDAGGLVERLFYPASGRGLVERPLNEICFGRWGSNHGEELVVCRRALNRVEVHCHGGLAAVEAVVESLVSCGAKRLTWREWLANSATADNQSCVDPFAAQALEALARAPTERTATILLDQFQGALRRAFDELERLRAAGSRDEAAALARQHLQWAEVGRHLVEPFRVVLAGRPNVGKSSLINALVGFRRALVCAEPGTTRDVVTAATAFDGWPVELADTAGLRETGEAIEAEGVARAQQHLEQADLRVLVFDASSPWTDEDCELLAAWPRALVVHNKCDLAAAGSDRPTGIATSAIAGAGIDQLVTAIATGLVPEAPPRGATVPFLEEHVLALARMLDG